ncbi:purine-cytosine permease family protein [Cryptosporangium phraense]|uniref:Thiamine permease n=1 Tax=Cryptosporangium phraense TaxID=2593070 RepID=A0A545AZ60_9ACTN|nr:cytosine permease [Cryptosporangium phraense]TQS45875.1 thiamine permease [Cryptosporangium phraense]
MPETERIEQTGIALIPDAERRGRARDLGWLWAGTTLTMQTVLFGSFLPYLGLNLVQCAVVIVLGNLAWVVVGYASLQGAAAGTSIFAITRASFGTRGGRIPAFLNWLTQILYETLGLSVIALALLALLDRAGLSTGGTATTVALVVVAAVVQLVLPLLGHAWIMRALRWMTPPFVALFIVLTILAAPKVSIDGPAGGAAAIAGGFALVLAGGSFAWVVNASDYSRYLPASTSRRGIVTAVSVGGFLSTTPLMILGAAVASIPAFGGDIISGLPSAFPAWFVVPYLVFVIAQNYGVNAVDMYSSSLTLQAVGLPLRQWQATTLDCALSSVLTITVLLSPSVNTAISNIILFVMVWIAPWSAVFLTDWALRRGRYDRQALFEPGPGPYWGTAGYRVPALVALGAGAAASLACINTAVFVGPVARALGGADLSIPAGFLVAAVVFLLTSRTPATAPAPLLVSEVTR